MIPAVTSTSAASTSTAAARHAPADDSVAAVAVSTPVTATPTTAAPASSTNDEAATVTISEQAATQEATAQTVKPDWTFQAADGNKDGKVTVFEQQVYDFRHYPSSLEKAKAYNETSEEPKPDAGLTA